MNPPPPSPLQMMRLGMCEALMAVASDRPTKAQHSQELEMSMYESAPTKVRGGGAALSWAEEDGGLMGAYTWQVRVRTNKGKGGDLGRRWGTKGGHQGGDWGHTQSKHTQTKARVGASRVLGACISRQSPRQGGGQPQRQGGAGCCHEPSPLTHSSLAAGYLSDRCYGELYSAAGVTAAPSPPPGR